MKDVDDALEEFDSLASERGVDWIFRCDTASECAWSCSIEITPKPDSRHPKISTVIYRGGLNAVDIFGSKNKIVKDAVKWLKSHK